MSLGDQLRQRAAMGGEREQAELAAFERLLAESLAQALVAELRREATADSANHAGLTGSSPDDRTR